MTGDTEGSAPGQVPDGAGAVAVAVGVLPSGEVDVPRDVEVRVILVDAGVDYVGVDV
jgi:hypothetical protein